MMASNQILSELEKLWEVQAREYKYPPGYVYQMIRKGV